MKSDVTPGVSSSREQTASSRKSNSSSSSSSKRGKRLHPVTESPAAPTNTSSKSIGSSQRSAASVVVNMNSSISSASGTSVTREQVTGSSSASGTNRNKQHNGGVPLSSPFGRLRRLLNPINLTRTAMATTAAAVSSSGRTASSSSRAADSTDSAVRTGRSSLCQYSSYDFDSNSMSSLRTATDRDDHHPHLAGHAVVMSSAGHSVSSMKQLTRDRSRHHSSSSGSRKFSCVIQVNGPHPHHAAGRDHHSSSSSHRECPLCLLELPDEFFPDLCTCEHRACYDCLQQYLKIEISESRVMVTCPECTELIHPNDIRMILNDESYTLKYEKFMLRRVLVAEPDARWCPAPDCGFVVIAAGCAGCPKLQCHRPGCDTDFCYHCKQQWHPNLTCDAARAQRSAGRRGSVDELDASHHNPKDTDIKPCPTCKVLIIKMDDGSCNHMTCSVCGTEFCWLCMKQISDLHYLSPSGCTFWGKKPWSRKKKILWQLGMLVGAPVGIALIAGIAVPAIVIGIPVWVGRKLHARLLKRENMARKNKNAIVATGVVASVCVSPILALVAVGIGIPILLAYVYGVVPISLCRSGGCGVDTSSIPIPRHNEIDEDDDMVTNNRTSAADELSVDTALSNRVNPSIGEMSMGMSASVSMGSGSHLDRATCDRESASNAPLAGSITSATPSNRVEIHAEVSPRNHKRFSVSGSETASCAISLSDRLSHSCALDDGSSSMCACAGSISSRAAAAIANSVVNDSQQQQQTQNHPFAETQSLNEVVVVPSATSPHASSSLTALEKSNPLVENIRT